MPDELVLNVRQISQFPPLNTAGSDTVLLVQPGGIGAAYRTITASDLVATALSGASESLTVGGEVVVGTALEAPLARLRDCSAVTLTASRMALGGLAVATEAYADAGAASLRGWAETAVGGLVSGQANLLAGLSSLNLAMHAWANHSVRSFNGRIGAITLTPLDIEGAGGATVYSPTIWSARLDGWPTAPTPPAWDWSPRLATTAFVQAAFHTMKAYVDQEVGEVGRNLVVYADEAPGFAGGQTFWYDVGSGNLYIRYFDADRNSIWVYVGGPGAATPGPAPGEALWDVGGRAWDDGQAWWE